jgi:hypothetical protein
MDPKTFPTEEVSENSSSPNQATNASAPKDPMTVYAKYAIQREIEEAGSKSDDGATTQATSPIEAAKPAEATKSAEATKPVEATSPAEGLFKPVAAPVKYIGDMTAEELRIEEATRKAKQHSGGLKIFSGNGNMALSLEIARHLGINLGKATVGRFADGEANVVIHENVRGKDCYVIQPTCPPVNDNIMELLLMVSTLRRASARRITVVIPYYGYARQDRKMQVN